MSRYIDAEYLIQKINDNRELSRWAKDITVSCVLDTPVVDFKRVVYCKECKHAELKDGYILCNITHNSTREDSYCLYGRCKEG